MSNRLRRGLLACCATGLVAVALAGGASAGTLTVVNDGNPTNPICGNNEVEYVAATGERDRLVADTTHLGLSNATDETRFCAFFLLPLPAGNPPSSTETLTGRVRVEGFGAGVSALAPCTQLPDVTLAYGRGVRHGSAAACPNGRYEQTYFELGDSRDTLIIRGPLLPDPIVDCAPGNRDVIIAPIGVVRSNISSYCWRVIVLPPPLNG